MFKRVKRLVEEFGKLRSLLLAAAAVLSVALNIVVFLSLAEQFRVLSIIVSNTLTALIIIIAYKPIQAVLERNIEDRRRQIESQEALCNRMKERIEALETENKELHSKIDSRQQADTMASDLSFAFKLETMSLTKTGYIVKETGLDNLAFQLPDSPMRDTFRSLLGLGKAEKRILYIHKHYCKIAIGIDFSQIRYATVGDKTIFYGVEFQQLHDISSELVRGADDVDRCEILTVSGRKTNIDNDEAYRELKEWYVAQRDTEVRDLITTDVRLLCSQYTKLLRGSVLRRYPNIVFAEGISTEKYQSLASATNPMVREVGATMLLLTSVMTETQAIEGRIIEQPKQGYDLPKLAE